MFGTDDWHDLISWLCVSQVQIITRTSGAACQISWAERQRPPWASAPLSGAELRRPGSASGRLCCGALGCVLAQTPASPGVPPLRPALRRVAGLGLKDRYLRF